MNPDGLKHVSSSRKSFFVFVCLAVAVCSLLFILPKIEGNVSYPLPVASNIIVRHKPNDTRSGECLKNYFEDILLIIVYHFPFYESIPLLKSFYQDAFKNIVICGPQNYSHHDIMVVDVGGGYYGYECVGVAIRRYPHYHGYLYINDDMVVNWWTFSKLDKEKFWLGAEIYVQKSHIMGHRPIISNWPWWSRKTQSAKACEDSYLEITQKYSSNEYINITKLVKTHLVNCEGVKRCLKSWSDLFYVPRKFGDQFQRISFVFHRNRVFLETAVPTILSFLDLRSSWENHCGIYLPSKYGNINFADGKIVWKNYNYNIKFIHPVKFHGNVAKRNRKKLRNKIIPYSKRFTNC